MTGAFVARGRIFSGPLAGATAHVAAFVEGGNVARNSFVDADGLLAPRRTRICRAPETIREN